MNWRYFLQHGKDLLSADYWSDMGQNVIKGFYKYNGMYLLIA